MADQSDKAYFSDGIEQCMDSLYGLALRLTRNSADAEDLVAEAVTKAWSALTTLEDRNRFRPWLCRILHNCFVSEYRKKAVRPVETSYDETPADGDDDLTLLLIQQPDEFLDWWGNPEREFINQFLGEEIMSAIEKLPEAFRIAVMLVNVEGFTYDEAAEILDVPKGTVHSRMKRARTLLQKALWEHACEAGLVTSNETDRCKI